MVRRRAEEPVAHLELIPAAPELKPVVANLLELYAHDFSEFHDLQLGADGRFGYRDLPRYWREPHRHPFVVRVGGNLAGLVLVKRGSEISGAETVWDMAEFLVVRGYRRRGIGTKTRSCRVEAVSGAVGGSCYGVKRFAAPFLGASRRAVCWANDPIRSSRYRWHPLAPLFV
jgi:hypothetical protein